MIYEISNILVRVPMLVVQIGMLYELVTKWQKNEENKIYSFIKGAACVFVFTQVMHLVSYSLLKLIQLSVSQETWFYVEEMLGKNIYNILIYIIYIVVKLYMARKSKQRFIHISLISCIFAMIQIVFYYYLFLSNPAGLTERVVGIATICSMIVLFVHGAMLELMERIIKNQKKQNEEEKRLLEKKYEYDYYLLAEEQEIAIRKIHQDMAMQIGLVQSMMQEKDENKRKEAAQILGQMEAAVNQFGRIYYCKDVVLNTILSLKQERARKHGMEMDIIVDSIAKTEMEDIDLCSVTTNLLDNAIEATEKVIASKSSQTSWERIRVRIGKRGGYLVICVENPALQVPIKNKKGRFVSTKKETTKIKEHGRGIRIVEKTLEKYDGHLTFKEEDGRVIVTAFIQTREGEVGVC